MPRYRVGTVSREHVKLGEAGGFCQHWHGKAAPVKRMQPGDWLIYYSPKEKMRGGEPVQAFTAIGQIEERDAYPFTMANGFTPTRRDITYQPAKDAPIRPMLKELSFTANQKSWGMIFRRGVFEIGEEDFFKISKAMGIEACF